MCGIVAATAKKNIVPILIEGLNKLEYRGYDSAGIAILNPGLTRIRSVGRVKDLSARIDNLTSHIGIAHTRWATHGIPAEHNAHPHISDRIAVVHNGIIENYEELKTELIKDGYIFTSDTDTEVIAHLINYLKTANNCDIYKAVEYAIGRLEGAYALAVLEEGDDCVILAKNGAPLLIGICDDGHYAASDTAALLQVTNKIVYLEDGDMGIISNGFYGIKNRGIIIDRPVVESQLTVDSIELGQFRHFMQKEIFEQPYAIAQTLNGISDLSYSVFGAISQGIFEETLSVLILACGTSYHSGLVAKYWIEKFAKIPCNVEIASEYRYREAVYHPNTLVIAISQSGETADTLAALKYAKAQGMTKTLAICNVPESAIVREASLKFITRAGPEIGVASTKAFTTQLTALALLSLTLAKYHARLSEEDEVKYIRELRHLPRAVQNVLEIENDIADWSKRFAVKEHALFLGRGHHYPIAMEGALKLKEISYIHAEAYAAGELKHGPLAIVDENMPVIVIAPNDALLEKLSSNMQEVKARGGELYVFADADSEVKESVGVHIIRLPEYYGFLSPILHVISLQLLAYHVALVKGTDVDKPRNLAKSCTVE